MTMTRDQIAELKRLAEKATPGEWQFGSYAAGILITAEGRDKYYPIATMYGDWAIPWDSTDESKLAFNDAAFIAAANPQTILSLLALAERALEPQTQVATANPVDCSDDFARYPQPQGQALPELPKGWPNSHPYSYTADDMHAYARAYASQLALPAAPVPEDAMRNFENFEKLTRALEIIAVGDSNEPAQTAASALADIGFWERVGAPSPAVAQPVADEREMFEEWCKSKGLETKRFGIGDKLEGEYFFHSVVDSWEAWQHRALMRNINAGRYEWLRKQRGQEHDSLLTVQHELDGIVSGADLDAAIDHARAALCPSPSQPVADERETIFVEREQLAPLRACIVLGLGILAAPECKIPGWNVLLGQIDAIQSARAALCQPAEEGGKS